VYRHRLASAARAFDTTDGGWPPKGGLCESPLGQLFVFPKKRKQTTRRWEGIFKWMFFIIKLPCERENSAGVVFKQIKQLLFPEGHREDGTKEGAVLRSDWFDRRTMLAEYPRVGCEDQRGQGCALFLRNNRGTINPPPGEHRDNQRRRTGDGGRKAEGRRQEAGVACLADAFFDDSCRRSNRWRLEAASVSAPLQADYHGISNVKVPENAARKTMSRMVIIELMC